MNTLVLTEAVASLCRKVEDLRARVEALEPPPVETRAPEEWGPTSRRLTSAAVRIFEMSETDTDAEVLAKMLAADGSISPTKVLQWLRMVVCRGEGDPRHPLFPYLVNKKPLRFGKKQVANLAQTAHNIGRTA